MEISVRGDFIGLCDRKVSINMCRIRNDYGAGVFFNSRNHTPVNRMSHPMQILYAT